MAISLSTTMQALPNHNLSLRVALENPFSTPSCTQHHPSKWQPEIGALTSRKSTITKVLSRSISDPLTSTWRAEREGWVPMIVKEEEEKRKLVDCWREIQGEDDWVGLLDPMDSLLRAELIRYGEMAQACYDAFDFDQFSKYCGSCKWPRSKFFMGLEMEAHGYDVTKYLYATSNINLPLFFKNSRWPKVWSKNANWIGYVAVSNDEMSKQLGRRDITISWRGTVTRHEWVHDLMDYLIPVSDERFACPDSTVKVESGFMHLYTDKDPTCRYCKFSAREQILAEVKRLMELYHDEEVSISVTGHSLGSALAILSAYDIAETGLHVGRDNRARPVSVFSFSGPRVGNVRFKERLEWLGVKVLRVVNVHDMVPKAPGLLVNENVPAGLLKIAKGSPWSYCHVGVELALDHKNSPFLKETNDPGCAHNLEAHLHLLDGRNFFSPWAWLKGTS